MPGRIGETFGSYELIQLLGRGGFAEVYLGKHTQLPQQMAAVKILEKQLIQAKSQQFQKEASIVATLRHPHIVQMYDYNVYNNPNLTATLVPYIVMEYAPNKSLRVKHPRRVSLPLTTIITYTIQIADALQYAHSKNIMHLDVKPENILINAQHQLLLSDFGLATLLTEEEKTGDIQGTLSYMSPEQLMGKPDFASDQYALGIMVYEWICGHLPFSGHSVKEVIDQHLKAPPPSLCAQVNALSPKVEAVVMKALAKDAADRHSSISDFANALKQAINGSALLVPGILPPPGVNQPPAPIIAFPAMQPAPVQAGLNQALPQAGANQPLPYIALPATPGPFLGALNQASPQGAGIPAPAAPPLQVPSPGPRPAAGLLPMANAGASPFQAGPPPGAQAFAASPFQTTTPPMPFATTLVNPPPSAGATPGAFPPFTGSSSISGNHASFDSWSKSMADTAKTILKPPPLSIRRRRRPTMIAGLTVSALGAIIIGIWLSRLLPSYGNETAWWGLIFSLAVSLSAVSLFFNSGNKLLTSVLSLLLAIYWGFVGHAFATITNAGVGIPFLPDANVMAVLFFLGAFALHTYLAHLRR